MHAGLALGEESLRASGSALLVVSRPGYGRTRVGPLGARDFAAVVAELCDRLGHTTVEAVVGISAGGRTAVELAARHPSLVRRLVLQSAAPAVGPWPDSRLQRRAAPVLFGPRAGTWTWAATRLLLTRAPELGLRAVIGPLTTGSARSCLRQLTTPERTAVLRLFCEMSSGTGFANDLQDFARLDPVEARRTLTAVACPTLVMASRADGSVAWTHAQAFATTIPGARLYESSAPWHLIWFGADRAGVEAEVRAFLATPGG